MIHFWHLHVATTQLCHIHVCKTFLQNIVENPEDARVHEQKNLKKNIWKALQKFHLPSAACSPGRVVYFAKLLGLVLATDLALTTRR